MIHRVDIHLSILEVVQNNPLIQFKTSVCIKNLEQDADGVTLTDSHGNTYRADAVIGCDGVRSVVRDALHGEPPRVTGHVVYRAVVEEKDMPEDLRVNAPMLWAGPRCHLVHYPLRGGKQYNLVVTFHSKEQEEWGVTEGSKEEVMSYFEGIHPRPRQMLDRPTSWRRWATADRDPVENWGEGRVTILGDAAHPMTQYLAQGACSALEDAVVLGQAVKQCNFDLQAAFRLYETIRIPRTARILWSAREMGRLYHAKGVERQVRNQLWDGRTQEQFYDAMQWLYGWSLDNCMKH
ncbi:3-hydroxybenzoate 6-hydroxylase [compost metagenome]